MQRSQTIAVAVLAVVAVWILYEATQHFFQKKTTKRSAKNMSVLGAALPELAETMSRENLHVLMLRLWMEHVAWTRNYILVALLALPNEDAIFYRLLRNQVEIGNAMSTFYGEKVGNQINKLLQEHILIAGAMIKSLKESNVALRRVKVEEWYRNADEIAKALSSINPNWPFEVLKSHMYDHLDSTTQEIMAYHHGLWMEDISSADKVTDCIVKLAKVLTDGICKQFNLV